MNKPKVSILIPAYNHEKYLKETIDSVLNQTMSDFELLISDDCSTDNTADVIRNYSDERIKSVFFEKNVGTVRALNYLLQLAKGEYIAVLGSDDVWEKEKLEKQINILEQDKSLAACFSTATIIDQNSDEIIDKSIFPVDIFEFENRDKALMLREFFASGNHLCHSSALIRRDIHEQVGEYSVCYRQLHDFDLWVRILIGYKIHVTNYPLVRYRFISNSGNVSQNTEKNNFRLYNEAEEIISFLFENISDEDFIKGFSKDFTGNNITTATQIACEKFLILKKTKLWGANNTSLALRFLFKHLNDEMLVCFERDYGISLNDIYDYTAAFKANYYAEIYSEFNQLWAKQSVLKEQYQLLERQHRVLEGQYQMLEEQYYAQQNQIEEIYASSSWRITKPLRTVGEKIRGKKG